MVSFSALLGHTPGNQLVPLRRALLLTSGEPDEAACDALLARDYACSLAPDETDGQIDGYELCCQLMYDEGLDGDSLVGAIIEYLDALWPEDYRRYRYRYAQLARQARISRAENKAQELGPRLDYRAWSTLVCELHAEIRHRRHAGVKTSREQCELSGRLLCQPYEPLPVLNWTVPPKLQAERSG